MWRMCTNSWMRRTSISTCGNIFLFWTISHGFLLFSTPHAPFYVLCTYAYWMLVGVVTTPNHQEPKLGHLYLYHNGTGPPNATLVATQLQTLLSITGTLAKPVRGVVVKDIQFRDAAQTFLEPHGVPSCGDW